MSLYSIYGSPSNASIMLNVSIVDFLSSRPKVAITDVQVYFHHHCHPVATSDAAIAILSFCVLPLCFCRPRNHISSFCVCSFRISDSELYRGGKWLCNFLGDEDTEDDDENLNHFRACNQNRALQSSSASNKLRRFCRISASIVGMFVLTASVAWYYILETSDEMKDLFFA